MTPQTIVKHILRNISRIKSNQTLTFGQLTENNTWNIIFEKSNAKYGGKTSPRSFSGTLNWAYLWINSPNIYTVCFYCIPNWGL